jgi:hypothetical protein
LSSYNEEIYDFDGFHNFIEELITENEARRFFARTLPQIIQMAMKLPEICPKPIPILLPYQEKSIVLSQIQICW